MPDIQSAFPYKPETFGELMYNMLKDPNRDNVRRVAEAYCDACGGLPEDCTCIDAFVDSPVWKLSDDAIRIIPELVGRVNHA